MRYLELPRHTQCLDKMIRVMNENPGIWFSKPTMAKTIQVKHRTVSRTLNKIADSGILLIQGKYFTKKPSHSDQWMINSGLLDVSNKQPYGWSYYGKSLNSHRGSYHYVLPGATKSVCGQWKISQYEMRFLKFIQFSEIIFSRQCGKCIDLMNKKGLDITKDNEDMK